MAPPVPPEIIAELTACLNEYAACIDEGDFDGLRAVFTEDARIDFRQTGGAEGSLEAILSFLREELSRFRILQHFISNVRVERASGALRSQAYVLAKHGFKRDGAPGLVFFTLGGEYEDVWRHTTEGWRITRRTLHLRFLDGATQ